MAYEEETAFDLGVVGVLLFAFWGLIGGVGVWKAVFVVLALLVRGRGTKKPERDTGSLVPLLQAWQEENEFLKERLKEQEDFEETCETLQEQLGAAETQIQHCHDHHTDQARALEREEQKKRIAELERENEELSKKYTRITGFNMRVFPVLHTLQENEDLKEKVAALERANESGTSAVVGELSAAQAEVKKLREEKKSQEEHTTELTNNINRLEKDLEDRESSMTELAKLREEKQGMTSQITQLTNRVKALEGGQRAGSSSLSETVMLREQAREAKKQNDDWQEQERVLREAGRSLEARIAQTNEHIQEAVFRLTNQHQQVDVETYIRESANEIEKLRAENARLQGVVTARESEIESLSTERRTVATADSESAKIMEQNSGLVGEINRLEGQTARINRLAFDTISCLNNGDEQVSPEYTAEEYITDTFNHIEELRTQAASLQAQIADPAQADKNPSQPSPQGLEEMIPAFYLQGRLLHTFLSEIVNRVEEDGEVVEEDLVPVFPQRDEMGDIDTWDKRLLYDMRSDVNKLLQWLEDMDWREQFPEIARRLMTLVWNAVTVVMEQADNELEGYDPSCKGKEREE